VTRSFVQEPRSSLRSQQRAFTLVEMIVVMAIIGVLAAILIPTIRAAMVRAKVSAIAADLSNLDAALNQFKEKYQIYPPGWSNLDLTVPANMNYLVRSIQKMWPRITRNELALFAEIVNHRGSHVPASELQFEMDAAEALVFWLGGFSEDPNRPFTGFGGPFSGGERNQDNAYFPWDSERLTETGQSVMYTITLKNGNTYTFLARESDDEVAYGLKNDPFPVVLARDTSWPIAYFNSANYPNASYPPYVYGATRVTGHAHPYQSDRKLVNGTDYEWINLNSYQLVSAGLDEDYGVDSWNGTIRLFKRYTSGVFFQAGDNDNITNFSGGTLEDAQ